MTEATLLEAANIIANALDGLDTKEELSEIATAIADLANSVERVATAIEKADNSSAIQEIAKGITRHTDSIITFQGARTVAPV